MRALDDHQRAATALAVAADGLNRALLEADRVGLIVDLVVRDNLERLTAQRVIVRAMLPVPATAGGG